MAKAPTEQPAAADQPGKGDEWSVLTRVSHDIRAPMNGITGLVELLLDTELSAEQRRSVELIQISTESLLSLLNDILDCSKLRSDQVELENVPFDLPGLVDSTVRLLAVRGFERGIELTCHIAPDVPRTVRGDPSRLRQILTNLVGNAVKFTKEGGVSVELTAAGMANGKVRLRFAIRDTGIGIPADKLDAIFGEFVQVHAAADGQYGGTGLGLSIARRLVGLMGGDITVTSETDKGSTFTFTVLLAPVLQAAKEPRPTLPNLGAIRVLVVDDNPSSRKVVLRALQDAGMLAGEAGSAKEGLEEMRCSVELRTPYHVAVIDSWMPGLDGFELAQVLRTDPLLNDTRIVMLTAAGRRGDGQRCRELRIQAYLTKPVSDEELVDTVSAVLSDPDALVTRHSIEESRRRLHVLLADDNEVNRKVAVAILQKRGHQVDAVEHGRAAADAAARAKYDVVLMDVEMPILDGIAATAEIRRQPANRDLPIIALTAHLAVSDPDRYRSAGMNAALAKPFKPQELIDTVEALGAPTPASRMRDHVGRPSVPVNLSEFRRVMREAGIEETVETILTVYREDAPGRMEALDLAVRNGRTEEIRLAAHAFKSAAATVRAESLAALLGQVEAAGASGSATEAQTLIDQVGAEHQAVLHYLGGGSDMS